MREIKFRAWVKNEVKSRKGILNATYDTFTIKELMSGRYKFEEYDNFEQYTGLKDKTGKEIYEGDIVKEHGNKVNRFNGNTRPFERIFVVEYKFDGYSMVTNSGIADFEILGNISENPELLQI